MQLVTTVLEQTGKVQVVSPGASVKVVTGESERAVHSLTGEAGGCFPGAVEEEEHGIAVGRREVELEAVDDEDDGDEGGGAGGEVPGDAVASSPSCDPLMSQGC